MRLKWGAMVKIKILVLALTLIFAQSVYAKDAPSSWQPELKIGVMFNLKNATILTNSDCFFIAKDKKVRIKKGEVLAITFNASHVEIKGNKFDGDLWEIRPDDPRKLKDLVFRINGKSYRGGLRLILKGNAMTAINVIPSEEYLRGVVPEEMPPLWAKEALKAQTVAARTFALKNRHRHKKDGYDLCTSVHCQVYSGQAKEHANSDAAIRETYGEVLFAMPNGPIIDTPFHTDSGGMTENNEALWGVGIPYLRAAKELEEKTKPWDKEIPLFEFEKKVGLKDIKKIELSKLEFGKRTKDRTVSGRVKQVLVASEKQSKFLTGAELRNLFNLSSTLFDMELSSKSVKFSGYGIGHGIGLSQWGAKAFAENGMNYKDILVHYYKKTFIKKLY